MHQALSGISNTHDAGTDTVFEQPEQQDIAHDIARVTGISLTSHVVDSSA